MAREEANKLKEDINPIYENMRKATKEETKSTAEYIDSISTPTGFSFDEAYETLDFIQPHKKLSVNLKLCEDCISREAVLNIIDNYGVSMNGNKQYECVVNGLVRSVKVSIHNAVNELPSVTPTRPKGEWIEKTGEGFDAWAECSECGCVNPFEDDFNYCPNCGADMRGEE